MSEGKKKGRPLKFKSAKKLQEAIDLYFESCFVTDDVGVSRQIRPFTITGLAIALDVDRRTLINYESSDEFFPTIKKAKLKCENYAEEALFTNRNTAGVIFNMTNNYGWKNKQNVDHTTGGKSFAELQSDEKENIDKNLAALAALNPVDGDKYKIQKPDSGSDSGAALTKSESEQEKYDEHLDNLGKPGQ